MSKSNLIIIEREDIIIITSKIKAIQMLTNIINEGLREEKIIITETTEEKFRKCLKNEKINKLRKSTKSALILDVLKGRGIDKALRSREIKDMVGLNKKQVEYPLINLIKKGIINHTPKRPYKYYDASVTISVPEKAGCGARGGRIIIKEECNPNPEHESCKMCLWGS